MNGQTNNPKGLSGAVEGWIEEGSSGFETSGHYYQITSKDGDHRVERFVVLKGLLISIEPALLTERLVEATVVFEHGLHVKVYPKTECKRTIDPVIRSNDQLDYVVCDFVERTTDVTAQPPPMENVVEENAQALLLEERPPRVFISYCHADEELLKRVGIHLEALVRHRLIQVWTDCEITPGQDIDPEIEAKLRESEIIMFLVSPDYRASEYCNKEVAIALELHQQGEAVVVPTILRVCDWEVESYGNINALPTDGKSVSKWPDEDEAFNDIAIGIKRIVSETIPTLRKNQADAVIHRNRANLLEGRDVDKSARRLGDLVIEKNSVEALLTLWETLGQTTNLRAIVDACAYTIGRIIWEPASLPREFEDQCFKIFERSTESDSKPIIDKFAFTVGEVALNAKDDRISQRARDFITTHASSSVPFVRSQYEYTWNRINE